MVGDRCPIRPAGAVVAAVVLAASARRARDGRVGPVEEAILRRCNDLSPPSERASWAVMQSGSLGASVVVGAVVGRARGRDAGVTVAALGAAVWLGVKAIKPFVGRGRPHDYVDDIRVRGTPQRGLGFPSGHAAVSLALALASTRGERPSVRAAAVAGAGVTGLARIHVGAHLPLDVVGGWAIGALTACALPLVVDATTDRKR